MALDWDLIWKWIFPAIVLVCVVARLRRKAPDRGDVVFQMGDVVYQGSYVTRAGRVYVTTEGLEDSAPLQSGRTACEVAEQLIVELSTRSHDEALKP